MLAYAERVETAPVAGETAILFGTMYTVEGIDFRNTDWPGTGLLTNFDCGNGVGFAEGAGTGADRIFLTDECGAGGEDIVFLTGVDPVTYEPGPIVSTAAYIVDDPGGHAQDPVAIDWISDVDEGAGVDINLRYVRSTTGSVCGQDLDGIPYADSENGTVVDYYPMPENGGVWSGGSMNKPWGSCTNARDDTATRWYVGHVNEYESVRYFSYAVFDLGLKNWVSNYAVHLVALGTPDENHGGVEAGRDLRAMAFDGTYYYVMYRRPGVNECHLARYTSFPDPGGGGHLAHTEIPSTSRLDDPAGGVAWPDKGTPGYHPSETLGDGEDLPERGGIACGRLVSIDGTMCPVFYVLCDTWLYTLAPVPTGGTAVESKGWEDYR